jgi:outer membrane lipoprotein SlyB
MTFESSPGAVVPAPNRTLWIVGGLLGLTSLAVAGTVAVSTALPDPAETATGLEAVAPARPALAAGGRTVAAAPACVDCGVVESVRSVTRKGQGSGLGAADAGQPVEKRARSHTVHELRVRMDDGSLRLLEQFQPSAQAGDRVVVEGSTLKPAPAAKG